jgi:hypothetical protein
MEYYLAIKRALSLVAKRVEQDIMLGFFFFLDEILDLFLLQGGRGNLRAC